MVKIRKVMDANAVSCSRKIGCAEKLEKLLGLTSSVATEKRDFGTLDPSRCDQNVTCDKNVTSRGVSNVYDPIGRCTRVPLI